MFNSRKISSQSRSGGVADDSFLLVCTKVLDIVDCVDTPKVRSVTNGALEDTEAMFFPDEAVETMIDLEICTSFSAIMHVNITAVKRLILKEK